VEAEPVAGPSLFMDRQQGGVIRARNGQTALDPPPGLVPSEMVRDGYYEGFRQFRSPCNPQYCGLIFSKHQVTFRILGQRRWANRGRASMGTIAFPIG